MCDDPQSQTLDPAAGECVCSAGYEPVAALGGCDKCPVGYFKDEASNERCTACGNFQTTNSTGSADAAAECLCETGFFSRSVGNRSDFACQVWGGVGRDAMGCEWGWGGVPCGIK